MTSRGRGGSMSEWDPMRDDFNDTSYNAQYPDEDVSEVVQLDHTKLYITKLPAALSQEGFVDLFSKYGRVVHSYFSRDPQKRYAFVSFETAGEARIAMMKLNNTEPFNMSIHFAHNKNNTKTQQSQLNINRSQSTTERQMSRHSTSERQNHSIREDSGSISSRGRNLGNLDDNANGNDEEDENEESDVSNDPKLGYNLEKIKLQRLQLMDQQLQVQQRMLIHQQRMKSSSNPVTKRRLLPDGLTIQVTQDNETSFTAGGGDSNNTACSCQKTAWAREESDGSSTPSTCVLCSEDPSPVSKLYTGTDKTDRPDSKDSPALTVSKSKQSECSKIGDTVSKRSDATSKKCEVRKCACRVGSNITCDLKFRDFYAETDDEIDETNRLIQMRNSDYLDIVDDELKLVIALAGYPKSKMRLRQMELFQRCLREVVDMQAKAGLLLKDPSFLDYYLNRGAIVCICKDLDTRDWLVRICPGLQERMCYNLVLLNSDVKRLCLAVLKIPRICWPATAQDAFKLLQYFNPALKTSMWKIYAQKVIDNVECTSFLIDRVSGEIIRGPTFKNVIDYDQMEFELTGYTEIYYECLLAGMEQDLSSVESRVKLLEEIKSSKSTPRLESTISLVPIEKNVETEAVIEEDNEETLRETHEPNDPENKDLNDAVDDQAHEVEIEEIDIKKALESSLQSDVLKKIKDVKYIGDNNEVLVWSDETSYYREDEKDEKLPADSLQAETTTTSLIALSEKSVSIIESNDNLLTKSSTINIDSNRGIAYHRRTNYLHVETELKVAITLEGYPVNKLEGTHIRRLKHLFKEYLHKDMKSQRFTNMIIPKFQDIYLSNGAVIYICDSLETKDYLTEILPKFINSTGLKLAFRDVKNLVRYTRIVMRLPKEQAHIESIVILMDLQERYPKLNPSCWKYYSDVAGKQKREFGVEPESLDVIKSPDFEPTHEGEKLTFRIIDRQKRDISCDETNKSEDTENVEVKKQRDYIAKNMYVPIDPDIMTAPLTRIRTNHYTDLIADDLKLYVGPTNYPDSRIDEPQFHTIKRTFENIFAESMEKGDITEHSMPKFHDMYLFDGVIFIICMNMESRFAIEKNVAFVNDRLKISLKSTEFRGAVGIVSLVAKTDKETDDVIAILQKQNPRLRTKYWRKISTVRTSTKLDVILQIDKLSAQVIMDSQFNKLIGQEPAEFKLGHLKSLIKPKESLEELTKAKTLKVKKKTSRTKKVTKKKSKEVKVEEKEAIDDRTYNNSDVENNNSPKIQDDNELDPIIIEPESPKNKEFVIPENCYQTKIILKVPTNILPESEDDLNIIFDILEDKNPGLNTEIWQIYTETEYPCNDVEKIKTKLFKYRFRPLSVYITGSEPRLKISKSSSSLNTLNAQRNYPGLQRVASRRCVSCGALAELFCAGCRVTPYCEVRCQRRDWDARHRAVCHNLARSATDMVETAVASGESDASANGYRQPHLPARKSIREPPLNNLGAERDEKKFIPPSELHKAHQQSQQRKGNQATAHSARNDNRYKDPYTKDNQGKQDVEVTSSRRHTPAQLTPLRQPKLKPTTPEMDDETPATVELSPQHVKIPKKTSAESSFNKARPGVRDASERPTAIELSPQHVKIPKKISIESSFKEAMPGARDAPDETPAPHPIQIKPGSLDDTTPRKPLVPANYMIEKLPVGSSFLAEVVSPAAECGSRRAGRVCLTLHEAYSALYDQLCDDFRIECLKDGREYTPRIGESFAYLSEEDGDWYRARCLSRTRAALLDAGRVVSFESGACRRLPPAYALIPEFMAILKTNDFEAGDNLTCTILSASSNVLRVSADDGSGKTMVVEATRWTPEVEYPKEPQQPPLQQAPLKQPTPEIQAERPAAVELSPQPVRVPKKINVQPSPMEASPVVRERQIATPAPLAPPIRPALVPTHYMIEKLSVGDTFVAMTVSLTTESSKQAGCVCLTLHESHQEMYDQLCEAFKLDCLKDTEEYMPSIGETFAYLSEDEYFYRARRLTRTRAALLDTGDVVSLAPGSCRRLPASYENLPEFTALLKTNVFPVDVSLSCTILSASSNVLRVSADDGSGKTIVMEATRWSPEVEYPKEPAVPQPAASAGVIPQVPRPRLEQNSTCVLLDVTSLCRACVRPCHAALFDAVLQDTVQYGIHATPLKEPPHRGQTVVAKFIEDGIHYRAFVKRVNVAMNKYLIEYIEYGNEEVVPLERLYPCPPKLQLDAKPAQASLVKLSERQPVTLTPAAIAYIDNLKENAVELILTIPGSDKTAPSGSLVNLLIAKNCERASQKIEELCTPEWVKLAERGGDVLEVESRFFHELPYWGVPTTRPFTLRVTSCDLGPLAVGTVSGYEKGDRRIDVIYGELTKQITEYAESSLCKEPYLPKIEELCITKYKRVDSWVRSVAVESVAGPGSRLMRVLHLDYGDIEAVPAAALRKMMPEFVDGYPAAAMHFEIKNFPKDLPSSQLARAMKLMNITADGFGELRVTRCRETDDKMYEVEAPEFIAALTE